MKYTGDVVDTDVEQLLGDVFSIIAVQNPDSCQILDLQEVLDLLQQAVSLVALAGLFFNIYAISHGVLSS